jgi:hypothetical protein
MFVAASEIPSSSCVKASALATRAPWLHSARLVLEFIRGTGAEGRILLDPSSPARNATLLDPNL